MNGLSSFESGWPVFLGTLTRVINEAAPVKPARLSLDNIIQILISSLGYRRAHLELFDLPKDNSKISLTQSREQTLEHLYGPSPLATGQVMATKRSVIIENLKEHSDFIGRPPEETASLAFLCIPILYPESAGDPDGSYQPPSQAKCIGAISIEIAKAPMVFLEAHCEFMSVAAAVIASLSLRLREELARPQRRRILPRKPTIEETRESLPVAVSKSMRLVLRQTAQAASASAPVLFRGEEGTGKEFLAEWLHAQSARAHKPFLKIGCGSEPPERIAETLFGVQKGEKSQATRSMRGLFELALGGTVFLDDIEHLSLEAQAGVLRVIQEGAVLRAGGEAPIPVDVRVLASTSATLEELSAQGLFLEDLYYGLSVMPIYAPSLRDRSGDILPLAEHFLSIYSARHEKSLRRISTPAIDLLNQYHWPGNVQELANCVERAVLLCDEGVIRTYHLPPTLQTAESSNTEPSLSFGDSVAKFEQELLVEALKKARGNMYQAARDLRESYRVVNYKVKKYGIDPKRFTPGRR